MLLAEDHRMMAEGLKALLPNEFKSRTQNDGELALRNRACFQPRLLS